MIDLTGQKYVTSDGFEVDLDKLPLATIVHACNRTIKHVMNNETESKALTKLKVKSLSEVPEAVRTSTILEIRAGFRDAMENASWAAGVRTRASKIPGESEFDECFRKTAAMHTRRQIAQKGLKAGPAKDTWFPKDDETEAYPLADWVEAYLTDPEFGEERREQITEIAKKEVEKRELERAHKLAVAKQQTTEPRKGLSL